MALSVGSKAPDFELTTLGADGPELVKLSDQLGDGNVVLLFVPMAFTGVCTEEFCSVTSELSEYENLNAKVFGISGDNPFAQQNWKEKEGIEVTLLSDYEHEVAKAYDVAYDAFLHGQERLMDVNPEVRAGARKVLAELVGGTSLQDQPIAAVSAGKTKKARGKRSKGKSRGQ